MLAQAARGQLRAVSPPSPAVNSHFCSVFVHMCEELGWNRGGWNPLQMQRGGRFVRRIGGDGAAEVWNTC